MNTAAPYMMPQQRNPGADTSGLPPSWGHSRPIWRILVHPLTAICVVQAVLSLSLIRSNTAYIDEADYLWVGRLEVAHWLHGTSWPSAYADKLLSGSPLIYPPIGSLANSIGGLAGARILSMTFMLGATVLLYFTALRLIGYRGAVISSALWAFSEPAIRLAFATYDALSVLLMAVAVWLILQVDYRRYGGIFAALASFTLAMANATAYSSVAIDPVVIAFAFLLWLHKMRAHRTILYTISLASGSAIFFILLIAISRSLPGLMYTVITRNVADYQGSTSILVDIWGYSGLVVILAMIGSIVAYSAEHIRRSAMLVLFGFAVFVVPVAQLHDQTAWSLDKHVAYGVWFAAITAGYGCSRLIRWLPKTNKVAVVCCLTAITYICANSWQSAWDRYHAWPDASSFISAFKATAAPSRGLIYVPGKEANIAQYYSAQGQDWTRWSASMSLSPVALPQTEWNSYYTAQLRGDNYGLVVLFYTTTFSSAPNLPSEVLLSPPSTQGKKEFLSLIGNDPEEPGLSALTQALQNDPAYKLMAFGPYDSAATNGIYAIWKKQSQK